MARTTFGFNVNGSEFDLIHVRNHENCQSLDFTHSKEAGESSRFVDDLQTLYDEVGFNKVRVHREMSPEEIKDFVNKAKTGELFNGIHGKTQEDIELDVYAYLQSKIEEYEINIELADMAVLGSR